MIGRRCLCTAASRPWLFIGLGNPGEKFQGTRHNVGFDMIDAFAESQGISMDTVHCKALFGQGFVDDAPVILAKPQTYMNLSGESTGPLAAYYKLPLNRVLVFHDDMDLPCGVLRLQPRGGHGSHNGLKNVIHHFRGNREFARLRIGIGRPPGQMDPKAFLLQKFNVTARERGSEVQTYKIANPAGLASGITSGTISVICQAILRTQHMLYESMVEFVYRVSLRSQSCMYSHNTSKVYIKIGIVLASGPPLDLNK